MASGGWLEVKLTGEKCLRIVQSENALRKLDLGYLKMNYSSYQNNHPAKEIIISFGQSFEPRIDNEHEGWEWVALSDIRNRVEVPTHSSVFDAFEMALSKL